MIFVIYWISWNVCLCWYCCFHVVQSSQQNQQCRKIVTQIFRCIFLSAKLVLHCFFVFILSTNLTNVTICGKLYWIFLLILFLCNTFMKKNYFQFFFHIYQMRLRIFIEIFACDFISCMVVWTVEPHVCIWMVYISYSNTFSLPFFSFCSMELHKTLTLDPSSSTQNTTPTLTSVQSQHAPMAIPISQLAMKPFPIVGYNGINGIAGLNGINGLNGLNVPVIDSVAAANQKNLTTKMRVGLTAVRADPKFSPYWWL